ncbi:hypothetical protein GCM10009678_04300 [Actinomadura kijaniata]|uniref:DUF6980 domain-containing protein n=1 Tax=Actinomadura namibiensis TaxID=182080 RepID=A0A7W3LTG0_ACTNM|nr:MULTISPECIES: hypothetical protein [Actinomadura]MBA8954001.1 hypothetical protein [Actinomadura namibiensis]
MTEDSVRFCCELMAEQVEHECEHHPDRFTCPDALVYYSAKFDEYGLIIHDGSSSVSRIRFCPWCGAKLPPSQRAAWFAALESRGIDLWKDEVPPEFETDAWRRSVIPSNGNR